MYIYNSETLNFPRENETNNNFETSKHNCNDYKSGKNNTIVSLKLLGNFHLLQGRKTIS